MNNANGMYFFCFLHALFLIYMLFICYLHVIWSVIQYIQDQLLILDTIPYRKEWFYHQYIYSSEKPHTNIHWNKSASFNPLDWLYSIILKAVGDVDFQAQILHDFTVLLLNEKDLIKGGFTGNFGINMKKIAMMLANSEDENVWINFWKILFIVLDKNKDAVALNQLDVCFYFELMTNELKIESKELYYLVLKVYELTNDISWDEYEKVYDDMIDNKILMDGPLYTYVFQIIGNANYFAYEDKFSASQMHINLLGSMLTNDGFELGYDSLKAIFMSEVLTVSPKHLCMIYIGVVLSNDDQCINIFDSTQLFGTKLPLYTQGTSKLVMKSDVYSTMNTDNYMEIESSLYEKYDRNPAVYTTVFTWYFNNYNFNKRSTGHHLFKTIDILIRSAHYMDDAYNDDVIYAWTQLFDPEILKHLTNEDIMKMLHAMKQRIPVTTMIYNCAINQILKPDTPLLTVINILFKPFEILDEKSFEIWFQYFDRINVASIAQQDMHHYVKILTLLVDTLAHDNLDIQPPLFKAIVSTSIKFNLDTGIYRSKKPHIVKHAINWCENTM